VYSSPSRPLNLLACSMIVISFTGQEEVDVLTCFAEHRHDVRVEPCALNVLSGFLICAFAICFHCLFLQWVCCFGMLSFLCILHPGREAGMQREERSGSEERPRRSLSGQKGVTGAERLARVFARRRKRTRRRAAGSQNQQSRWRLKTNRESTDQSNSNLAPDLRTPLVLALGEFVSLGWQKWNRRTLLLGRLESNAALVRESAIRALAETGRLKGMDMGRLCLRTGQLAEYDEKHLI
jgi:hypothetical protein